MTFNLNRIDNNLQITTNQLSFTSENYTSNIIIDLSSNTSIINMCQTGANFIGFMANTSGLYMKNNSNMTSFIAIGGNGVDFTPNIALELVANTYLNVLYDPDILAINGLNRLTIANAAITNAKLGNSAIFIDGQTLTLGTSYSNLALSLSNASNYSTANLIGTITNSQLGNSSVTLGGQILGLGSSLDTVNNWTVTNLLTANNSNVQDSLYFGNLSHYITYNSDTDKIDICGDVGILNELNISNSVTISGNLYVTGNTYFINSNVTTISDPVFYLGSNSVSSDYIDRGIAFRYQSNSVAKLGFMGYLQETQEFVYIPDANETPENNFTGANGIAHFGSVKVDSNIVLLGNGYLLFNGVDSNIGLRYNNSNIESKSASSGTWNKLTTLSDLIAGNGLIKSGPDTNTLDVQVDDTTIEINSDTLRIKNNGVTNAKLGNSAIIIDGQTLTLGTSYSNLALSLSNASNYSTANLIGTITNTQLGNSVITISGSSYTLGSYTANIALSLSNAIVFRSEANTFIRSTAASNLDISGTGNVNITANTDILLTTLSGGNVKIRGPTGSNQFAIIQSVNGNVYLNIGQTTGDTGYGIRSNIAGGLEFKNSGGSWTGFGTGSGGSGGTPGGSNTQIQFNDSSTFGGSANFTFNKATSNITITGNVSVSELNSATHIQAANTFTISQYTTSLSNLSGTQTVTLDFNQGSNFLITLAAGANITLANPSNVSRLGQQGIIVFKTPSSGTSHVLNWYRGSDSSWYFPDIISPPQISAGQNIYDVFNFMVIDTTSTGKVLVTDATGFQQFV